MSKLPSLRSLKQLTQCTSLRFGTYLAQDYKNARTHKERWEMKKEVYSSSLFLYKSERYCGIILPRSGGVARSERLEGLQWLWRECLSEASFAATWRTKCQFARKPYEEAVFLWFVSLDSKEMNTKKSDFSLFPLGRAKK